MWKGSPGAIGKLIVGILLLLAAAPALVAPMDAAERTLRFEARSEILEETREFIVRLPEDYHADPQRRYPVFYLSDADWNFELVAGLLDYLAHWERIPEFIVAGAVNVRRNRDFLPAEDPNFPGSGAGDRYLRHVAEEWLPLIEAQFRATENRVFFGHSFGGVLALNQLFTEPGLFDAYIALGTSVWVADRVLFERATAFFAADRSLDAFLYLAVGEGDGGATVPDGERLAALLREQAPASLEWNYEVMAGENHFTNVPIGLHRAIEALFPFWGFDAELVEAGTSGGPTAAEAWFAQKRDELGWRFHPQSMELGLAGYRLAASGHGQAAMAVFDELERIFPHRPTVPQFRAQALVAGGDAQAAMPHLLRAISLAQAIAFDPDRIQQMRNLLQRIQAMP